MKNIRLLLLILGPNFLLANEDSPFESDSDQKNSYFQISESNEDSDQLDQEIIEDCEGEEVDNFNSSWKNPNNERNIINSSSSLFQYKELIEPRWMSWNIYGELLYWKISEEATYFAIVPQQSIPVSILESNTILDEALGDYRSAKFSWHPGFRIGAGYTFVRDAWELFSQYTYYFSRGTNNLKKPSNPEKIINGTFITARSFILDEIKSEINFLYNIGDLMLGRCFMYGSQLLLKVSMGLTGGGLDQDWQVDYRGSLNAKIKNDWSFNGAGIRLQIDGDWHIGKGFGVFNRVGAAALVGKYLNKAKILSPDATAFQLYEPVMNTLYQSTTINPAVQMALGLNWGQVFENFKVNLLISGEANLWFNVHRVFRTLSINGFLNDKIPILDVSHVGLYGLTTQFQFDF